MDHILPLYLLEYSKPYRFESASRRVSTLLALMLLNTSLFYKTVIDSI